MHTYPEMNAKIVGILRVGGDENPVTLYAAARIEELEREVAALRSAPPAVKEHPIIFSVPMVRAILAGRKTQTRRVIKSEWWRCLDPEDADDRAAAIRQCPHGQTGDRLWVREKWRPAEVKGMVWYAEVCGDDQHPRWRSPIHMPRWASRVTLEITNVRIEQLQDISANDALAEGVDLTPFWTPDELNARPFEEKWWDDFYFWTHYPQLVFQRLWDHLNAKRGHPWASNPWVWVIEFRKVEK